jgi:hypothetical protein
MKEEVKSCSNCKYGACNRSCDYYSDWTPKPVADEKPKVKKYKYVCCECGKKYPCKLKVLGETSYKPEKCCYDKGMIAKWKLKKEKV